MSYVPLGDGRSNPHIESIELITKNNLQPFHNFAPPQGLECDENPNQNDAKAKALLPKSVANWPLQSQQVAALTPLRSTILAFDIVLASSPLLFIGMRCSLQFLSAH